MTPDLDVVAGVVQAAMGSPRRAVAVERLRGGTKKGVHRITLDDGSSAILYVWGATETYWPDDAASAAFTVADGIKPFAAAHSALTAAGVRVPAVHLLDASRTRYPSDVAVVEDVRGGTLEGLIERDPDAARGVVALLGGVLRLMREHRSTRFGALTAELRDPPAGAVVLDGLLRDITFAAAQVPPLRDAEARLVDVGHRLAAEIRPRDDVGLVHGELGPDHVLIDDSGRPVLIDIEGLTFFDVEREHVFLRLRFGEELYRLLAVDGLDPARLRLYRLAMHVSLVAGPLLLLRGGFPDRAFLEMLVRQHTAATLTFTR
ncbi:phosphotransferase [Actinomycetes bacterium KLBMP 9759]